MLRKLPYPFLLLLFVGTICNAMAMSFMGFYLVQGLGAAPWTLSVYTGLFAGIVIATNRAFAARMDRGTAPFPMIGIAAFGCLLAASALALVPGYGTVFTIGVLGFGLASSAMSTMFSLGRTIATRSGIPGSTFNAYMRATTSTSWMIGPALSFTLADRFGADAVFSTAVGLALVWLCLWWAGAPRTVLDTPPQTTPDKAPQPGQATALRVGVIFVFCLALAHALTFSALPIFFVREVGLPGYAPGAAFSLKTLAELVAIFSTPLLIRRVGMRHGLIGTACLATVSILVLATVGSLPHMFVGAALEGLYFGLFSTLAISFIQSLAAERPAHATALYWNTMMVTLVLAGPSAGVIAQITSFQTVVFIASGFAIAAALLLALSTPGARR